MIRRYVRQGCREMLLVGGHACSLAFNRRDLLVVLIIVKIGVLRTSARSLTRRVAVTTIAIVFSASFPLLWFGRSIGSPTYLHLLGALQCPILVLAILSPSHENPVIASHKVLDAIVSATLQEIRSRAVGAFFEQSRAEIRDIHLAVPHELRALRGGVDAVPFVLVVRSCGRGFLVGNFAQPGFGVMTMADKESIVVKDEVGSFAPHGAEVVGHDLL